MKYRVHELHVRCVASQRYIDEYDVEFDDARGEAVFATVRGDCTVRITGNGAARYQVGTMYVLDLGLEDDSK